MSKLFTFIIILFVSFSSKGQNNIWPDSLASWYYKTGDMMTIQGYVKYQIDRDTLIQSKNCKIYTSFSESINSGIPGGGVGQSQNNIAFITYQQDSILYHYDLSTELFDTIVDFKASPGDSWTTPLRESCSAGNEFFTKTVTDTGTAIINGQSKKWLTLNITYSASAYTLIDTIFQHIGSKNYFLINEECPSASDYGFEDFRCFHWNTDTPFEYHYEPTPQPCEFVSSVGIEEYAQSNLQIYPNPTSYLLNIISDHDEDIQFTDLNGRILLEAKLKPKIVNTFNIQDFESGIYYILCENKHYKVFKQ